MWIKRKAYEELVDKAAATAAMKERGDRLSNAQDNAYKQHAALFSIVLKLIENPDRLPQYRQAILDMAPKVKP